MKYHSFPDEVVNSPEHLIADISEVGTWFRLHTYCGRLENHGRIKGCRLWTDRQWTVTMALSHDLIHRETKLWWWDGNDLVLNGYNQKCQDMFTDKRKRLEAARAKRWKQKIAKTIPFVTSK